jgi:hypothetical protein
MKTFRKFIQECYFILLKEEKGKKVDYDYEHAFAKIYNHMISNPSKYHQNILRGAVQRGDIMTVIDYLSKEIYNAQNDSTHPLNFNQIDPFDGGLKGGKIKTGPDKGKPIDLSAYEKAYYEKLLNQQYSFLNFIQSKSGKKNFVKGYTANVEGGTKIQTQPRYAKLTGKDKDTSKVDVRFFDSEGNPKYGLSLKDSKGAVVNSSGAEETKALIILGISDLMDRQVNDGIITPEQRSELEQLATTEANKLALLLGSTKGMTKNQQEGAVEQIQSSLGDLELKIPGVIEAMSREAITAKGKFGDADSVDALFSSGRGGGVIEDPNALAAHIFQRARVGKGGTKQYTPDGEEIQRPSSISGDIKGKIDPEEEPTSSEWLRNFDMENAPAWEKRISQLEPELQDEIERIRGESEDGSISGSDLTNIFSMDSQLKSYKSFMKDAEKSQKELSQAEEELAKAEKEAEEASVPIDIDTKKPVLRQHRKNAEINMAADPTSRMSRLNSKRRETAELNLSNAQTNLDNAAATHDANVQQVQATQVQQPEPQQSQQQQPVPAAPEKPQQQQPAPSEPQQSQQQQPVPAAPEKPQQQQAAPQQPQQEPGGKKPRKRSKTMDTEEAQNNIEQ